jgi:predicted nucleotidyltransferase
VSHGRAFEALLPAIAEACRATYRERLVSLVVFGSVARGTPKSDSDIDLLVVADGLPKGRTRRMREFGAVKQLLAPELARAAAAGVTTRLSVIFKTRDEVEAGSPLFFDMTEDARFLHDRDGFMQQSLQDLRARLARLGAKRVWKGEAWYWDLKPDYQPGQVFEI